MQRVTSWAESGSETSSFLEPAIHIGDAELVHRLLSLAESQRQLKTTGQYHAAVTDRLLALGYQFLGEAAEKIRATLDSALQVATAMRFQPEIALTSLQLAELLMTQFPEERHLALDHLDMAIEAFERMKMKRSLERALELRGQIST